MNITTIDVLIWMILYMVFLAVIVTTLTVYYMVKEFFNEPR